MSDPRISIEQWRALVAVVEAGGYAQAATKLHKSQSAVTYAVQKLEQQLQIKAFELQGRRAMLTTTGQFLYQQGRALLDDAEQIERAARQVAAGWETELRIAVEVLFPNDVLMASLDAFGAESPHTRIEVLESVLGGTPETLLEGRADIALTPRIPPGFNGDLLLRMRLTAAAHPAHPLHGLGRPVRLRDLKQHRHLLVRDTSSARVTGGSAAVNARQRWVFSSLASSIEAACAGYGFAWYPEERIRAPLANGLLKVLPLQEGRDRFIDIYLVIADTERASRGARRLAELLFTKVQAFRPTDSTQSAP